MHILEQDADEPVHIMMNSAGGSWHDALAIYDCISMFSAPVTIEVFGKCMSAAVAIVQACCHRIINPNAVVMVHNGSQSGDGDAQSFESWGAHSKFERKRMYAILASRSHHRPSFWRSKCSKGDFILRADQAVKLGLFDAIVTLP